MKPDSKRAAGAPPDTFLARGKRGEAFLREFGGVTVLVKRKNPASAVDTIANEARCTAMLNAVGVGPRFISYNSATGELVRAYVAGLELRKWLPTASGAAARQVLVSVLRQCKEMDDLRLTKEEMTRPWKHVIVTSAGDAFLIDFERCRESLQPKNVTQFCQFLSGAAITASLNKKGFAFDTKRLLDLAKSYKDSLKKGDSAVTDELYFEIVQVISG